MAEIKPSLGQVGRADESAFVVAWLNVKPGDTCGAVQLPNLADKSIHVSGNFAGGMVALWGSNNGFTTPGAPLRGPNNVVLAIGAEEIRSVLEDTTLVKPVVTGGGAGRDISIHLLCKQNNPLRQ
jgi:hypothetical protein